MHENALLVCTAGASDLCDYGWRIAAQDAATAVRFVRGSKMRTANALFDEIAAACQFPYYFGENWAALAECLGDLDWLDTSRFVLVVTEFDQVLSDEAVEMEAFARALRSAVERYNEDLQIPESGESLFGLLVNGELDATRLGGLLVDAIGKPVTLQIR